MIIRHWNAGDLFLLRLYSGLIVLWRMGTVAPSDITRLATLSLGGIPRRWFSFAEAYRKMVVFGASDDCKFLNSKTKQLEGVPFAKNAVKLPNPADRGRG